MRRLTQLSLNEIHVGLALSDGYDINIIMSIERVRNRSGTNYRVTFDQLQRRIFVPTDYVLEVIDSRGRVRSLHHRDWYSFTVIEDAEDKKQKIITPIVITDKKRAQKKKGIKVLKAIYESSTHGEFEAHFNENRAEVEERYTVNFNGVSD